MDLEFKVLIVLSFGFSSINCDGDQTEEYLGKLLGRFNTFSHQVDGELYVINRTSFLLKNFYYDGSGKDTYFWVGSSNYADRRAGYPVPDEEQKTNVLKRYANQDLTLKLPANKQVADLKWFAIFDVISATTFAEVIFPEDFEPPGHHLLQELTRNAHDVKSEPVVAVDSKTLVFNDLNYDGLAPDTYFWVGSGPVPNSKGVKIPDENGYLEPLRPYVHANITLRLPGNMTIFDVDWLSIYNVADRENYGSMLFPHELNVPPSLVKSLNYYSNLAQCEQLHENLQLSWEINSPPTAIKMEIAGKIGLNDYISFGINENGFGMIGARAMIAYLNDTDPIVEEYYMSNKSQCLPVPKGARTEMEGVCLHSVSGKPATSIKVWKARRFEGITVINFTLSLAPGGLIDPFKLDSDMHIVWAIGHLNYKREPLYHYLRNTGDVLITFDRRPEMRRCFSFNVGEENNQPPWGPLYIANPNLFVFNVTLGPAGGPRGYEGITGLSSPGLTWYINGVLAPELYLKRGQKYLFSIEGGDDVSQPSLHHPFYITNSAQGGYETLPLQDKKKVNFYAGVSTDHKGRPIPLAAGRLCLWENWKLNPRNWQEFRSFAWFKIGLDLKCQPGKPFLLEWTPNGTIPDLVYYQSFRQRNMGNKIHIVDVVRPSKADDIRRKNATIFTALAIFLIVYLLQE